MDTPTRRARALVLFALLMVACGSDDDGGSKQGTGGAGGSGSASGGGAGGTSGAGGTGGTSGAGATSGAGGAGGTSGAGGAGGTSGAGGAGGAGGSGKWSMGYYAMWEANQYPVSAIEWSGMTHIAVSFYKPGASTPLSLMAGTPSLAKQIVDGAHAHGVKAIASIGGADSDPDFDQATSSANIDKFVAALIALLDDPGFDGIDIDWEPLTKADQAVAVQIATKVRALRPNAILTIPIGYQNVNVPDDLSGYVAVATAYDQLNVMSYGMSGAWSGWKSWHSSALYHQDSATPTSIDSTLKLYVAAGVPKNKLGLGIGFYGLCYTPPVTGPVQALSGSTIAANDGVMSYANIVTKYYSASARKWDSTARVPYLSFGSAQAPNGCSYISYDDEQSIAEKGAYVKTEGYGGVIIWEINEGYLASASSKNPLLLAVQNGVLE